MSETPSQKPERPKLGSRIINRLGNMVVSNTAEKVDRNKGAWYRHNAHGVSIVPNKYPSDLSALTEEIKSKQVPQGKIKIIRRDVSPIAMAQYGQSGQEARLSGVILAGNTMLGITRIGLPGRPATETIITKLPFGANQESEGASNKAQLIRKFSAQSSAHKMDGLNFGRQPSLGGSPAFEAPEDPILSRDHFGIVVTSEQDVLLNDANSTNGTFVLSMDDLTELGRQGGLSTETQGLYDTLSNLPTSWMPEAPQY